MNINSDSNKVKRKSVLKKWFKTVYAEHGPIIVIFPLLILIAIGGGAYDETQKSDIRKKKIEIIKSKKPLLVCDSFIRCKEEQFTNYNLVMYGEEEKIDLLDKNNTHIMYLDLDWVTVISEIN